MQVTHGNKKCLNSTNVCYSVLQEVQYLQVQHKPVSRLSIFSSFCCMAAAFRLVLPWLQIGFITHSLPVKSPSHSLILKEVEETPLHTSMFIKVFQQNVTPPRLSCEVMLPARDAGKASHIFSLYRGKCSLPIRNRVGGLSWLSSG